VTVEQVAGGLFSFPNGEADALLHVGTASIFVAGGLHGLLQRNALSESVLKKYH
jgi:hypothetical protein